jgi:DNA-binding HxlR family transcriptional regulator
MKSRSECVICNVLDLFGDKWTLLIIRDLFFYEKHEFKDFLASPEKVATNVLTDRLKRLRAHGIIDEIAHSENRSRKLYFLTRKGKDLYPILSEMAKWGSNHLTDLPAMQPLYARLRTSPDELRGEIFDRIARWEGEHLSWMSAAQRLRLSSP